MLNTNPYQQYQQNAVKSATPGELTLSLYNGKVKFIKQAILAVEKGDIETANHKIIRTQEIVSYLMDTLNPDFEISGNLLSLYDYMNRRLTEANIKKDKAILEEVLGLVKELRDTWEEAIKVTGGRK